MFGWFFILPLGRIDFTRIESFPYVADIGLLRMLEHEPGGRQISFPIFARWLINDLVVVNQHRGRAPIQIGSRNSAVLEENFLNVVQGRADTVSGLTAVDDGE